MTVYNVLNVHTRPKWYSENTLPSMTVPDQTMSMREILNRFARGQNPSVVMDLPYMDQDDIEGSSGININKLDLSEKMEILNNANNYLNNQNNESLIQTPIQTAPAVTEQNLDSPN